MNGQVWFSIGPLDPGSWQAIRDDEDLPDMLRFLWHENWRWLVSDQFVPCVWFSWESSEEAS